jgi:C1A family cysteine protease
MTQFNPKDFDLSNGSRFIIQIEQNNIPTLHPLRTSNDTLLLYRSDFQTDIIGSKSITYTIGFYDKLKKQTSQISKVKPYFDDAGEMEAIIYTLISSNKNKIITKQQELSYNEVYKVLGKPSDILFYTTFTKIISEIKNPVSYTTKNSKGLKEEIESYEEIPELFINTMRDNIDLPVQFSLRQYTPQVQSQGDYGTCVAWSSAYAARTVAWAVRNNYNNIDDAAAITKYSFSPQFLFLNIKSPGDTQCEDGSTLVNALKFMKEKGVITWDNVTYDCAVSFSEDDIKNAKQYKITDFQRLSSWFNIQDSTILSMKRSLAERKPLIVGMHLPNSFNLVDRKTGIWYPDPEDYEKAFNAKNISGKYTGHAMCIIGYNDNVNGGSFEIMNSWGKDSGKDGFYWVSYDDMKKFGSQVLLLNDSITVK